MSVKSTLTCDICGADKALAWTALLADKPSHYDLLWVINSAPEEYKALARKELK